ncbi:hypothetical protein [Agrobacterium vitis]|uniref:Uncharacterized protein n=1 Tax=Agrobacterium vitis TaxID=373 RepID=A0AAE2RCP7_AGRVI|nr:hypothetical protein [Agrobacterium vitis]MBF2716018.1 hypothetical protein [Agrobacterium vitis]MUZ66080.1 hypothetical protein [Agrobacterium vitis]MVA20901.1 hypothetical protein [Agrobacterium vitis]
MAQFLPWKRHVSDWVELSSKTNVARAQSFHKLDASLPNTKEALDIRGDAL